MDFYIILGVDRGSSLGEIRVYRRLARRFHPDINPGDRTAAAQFRQIAEAYQTLSDPDRRRQYDIGARPSSVATEVSVGFEGFDFSVRASGSSASTFGDLFADVIQQRNGTQGSRQPERGADLHYTLSLGFEEAVKGGQHQVTVTRQVSCRTCHGSGRLQTPESRCTRCQGTGALRSARGHMVFTKACEHCGGTGRQRDRWCPTCNGQQVETRTEPVTLNLPSGLDDDARVRIAGQGHVGRHGGPNGDLYITVRVQPHAFFRREGDDLHLVVPVAVHEAALGSKFDVPSLDGPVRLRVPPGTQSGQRFRLRERGVPSPRDGQRGDLVVEIRLVLPKLLDERSKELLREFGRINGEDVRRGLGD